MGRCPLKIVFGTQTKGMTLVNHQDQVSVFSSSKGPGSISGSARIGCVCATLMVRSTAKGTRHREGGRIVLFLFEVLVSKKKRFAEKSLRPNNVHEEKRNLRTAAPICIRLIHVNVVPRQGAVAASGTSGCCCCCGNYHHSCSTT